WCGCGSVVDTERPTKGGLQKLEAGVCDSPPRPCHRREDQRHGRGAGWPATGGVRTVHVRGTREISAAGRGHRTIDQQSMTPSGLSTALLPRGAIAERTLS